MSRVQRQAEAEAEAEEEEEEEEGAVRVVFYYSTSVPTPVQTTTCVRSFTDPDQLVRDMILENVRLIRQIEILKEENDRLNRYLYPPPPPPPPPPLYQMTTEYVETKRFISEMLKRDGNGMSFEEFVKEDSRIRKNFRERKNF